MSNYCHIWYNFKFGRGIIHFNREESDYEYDRKYRMCEICLRREFESVGIDNFRQIRCIWSSVDFMRVSDELNSKFLEAERDIKIKNILK